MSKLGVKVVKDTEGKKQRIKPFEDMFQIVAFYRIQDKGLPIGATILKKPKKESYRIVFGFECGGISPLQSEEEFTNTLHRLETGLKDLPKGETLTVHFGSFANDDQRQEELANLKGLEPELALLIASERKRTQELTKEGIRNQSFLRLYATYTIEDGEEKTSDWIEKSIQSIEGYWLMFTGQYKEHEQQKIELLLKTAYREGYQRWFEILSQQLKLGIRPISDEEEWSNLWSRFNDTSPRKIPYRIIYDGKNFTEDVNSNVHFISQLMESESSVPIGKRKTVEVNNSHIGVLLFADKPDGWADEGDQLRYLWEVISKDRVYDTEIFCQLQRGNERLMREKLRSLTKQSHVAAALASEKNDVDVGAQLKAQKTIEAQAALIEGDVPLHMSTVVLIHRTNTQDLDNACSNFIASFARQGWLVRETEYAWRVWCETFPQLTFDKLLSKPFRRLQTYQTSEAPGLLPLCKTPIIDDRGIEFISQEGGNPVYIDLYHKLRHVGVFGTTRSGKSLMLAQILAQALAHQIPATVLEFPKDDGTGTFSDFCRYLSPYCSYFDIGSALQGCNILEPPNLSGLDAKVQEERFASYQEYLLEVLFFLVFAGKEQYSTEIDPERVRTLLILVIRQFYQDLQITNRFAQAFIRGLGSTAWQSMPVLVDLLQFCSPERLDLIDADESTIKALKYIKLRMMGWKETKVGKILSRPTSFATEKLMQVVALRGLGNNLDAAVIGSIPFLQFYCLEGLKPLSVLTLDYVLTKMGCSLMETVTPVNPGEAKEVQQIQLQTSAQAIQVAQLVMELIEKLLSNLAQEKKDKQKNNQEQGNNQSSTAQDNKPSQNSQSSPYQDKIPSPASNSFNNLEITINGEKKLGGDLNNLTWEDYGKLQALVTQDVGNTLPELANIKVEKLTQNDGNAQRQTLLETDGNGTVLQNFAKHSQEEKKISGFEAVNRALSKLPDNETKTYLSQVNQQINQQFQQQQKLLENAQNLNQKLSQQLETSQSTLLESQKINLDYAKLLQQYQQAQQYRDPKDVKGWQNLVKNPLTPVKQWWQEQQQKWQEKSEDKDSAITVRDFAKKVIGKDNKISGDNYDIERNGQNYQLKSKEGKVLLNFESQGLLGIKINQANLTQFNKDDLHFLDKGLRKDPTFLVKNPQFFSLPEPQSQSELKKNDNVTVKSFSDLDKGIKRIKNNNNSNLNPSHNLDKQGVINPQQSITIQEFSRNFLEPKWSEELNQYITTGFDKEIGWETQKVPSEIANAVHNNQFRINDNYPPQQGEVALIAREFDKYAVLAVATRLIDDKDRPLVGYRYFWLEKEGNVDGVGTLLNWWEENEKREHPIFVIRQFNTMHILREKASRINVNVYPIQLILT